MSLRDRQLVWEGIPAFQLKPTSPWHRSFGGDRGRCGQLLIARDAKSAGRIKHTSDGVARFAACPECLRRGD